MTLRRPGSARGGCRRSRLRRRYGCFALPRVPGAKVREAKRGDVSWLARTDPQAKTIEFSRLWNELAPEAKRYIVLHERAHIETGPDHNARFYETLKRLISEHRIDWKVAYELESYNCHAKH